MSSAPNRIACVRVMLCHDVNVSFSDGTVWMFFSQSLSTREWRYAWGEQRYASIISSE